MIHLNNSYDLLIGGFYQSDESWNKNVTEIDNCFKIYRMTEGEAFIFDGEQTYTLEKGKTYLINGFKLEKQFCQERFCTFWFHFLPTNLNIHVSLLQVPCVVELSGEHFTDFPVIPKVNYVDANKEDHLDVNIKELKLQIYIESCIISCLERYPECTNPDIENVKRIVPAIDYIQKNYNEPIKLDELAKLCNMSTSCLHKLFKSQLHLTPFNCQSLLRMNAALHMLGDNKLSVKDIAERLSFTDSAHFNKIFKKYYGVNPTFYRKEKQEGTI